MKWVIIGSYNGLLLNRELAIIWANELLSAGPSGTNSNEIWITMQQFFSQEHAYENSLHIFALLPRNSCVNSLWPSDAKWCQWSRSWANIGWEMTCSLFGAKPLPELMLACCLADSWLRSRFFLSRIHTEKRNFWILLQIKVMHCVMAHSCLRVTGKLQSWFMDMYMYMELGVQMYHREFRKLLSTGVLWSCNLFASFYLHVLWCTLLLKSVTKDQIVVFNNVG